MDREFIKCLTPVMPGLALRLINGRSLVSDILFGVGLALTLAWVAYVAWNLLLVYSRWGDKRYSLVLRKQLSKEYRD
jgi:hypothetical protein